MGMIERINEKIKMTYRLLIFLIIMWSLAFAYTNNIILTIIASIIPIMGFVIWDIHERLSKLEKNIEINLNINNKKK